MKTALLCFSIIRQYGINLYLIKSIPLYDQRKPNYILKFFCRFSVHIIKNEIKILYNSSV